MVRDGYIYILKSLILSIVSEFWMLTSADGSTSQEVPHVQLKVIDLPLDQSLGELLPMEAKLHQRLNVLSLKLNVCFPNTIHRT